MLKLSFRQKIRLWLWQYRRSLLITLFCLLASLLLFADNDQLNLGPALLPLMTLAQLGIGAILVVLVIILSE